MRWLSSMRRRAGFGAGQLLAVIGVSVTLGTTMTQGWMQLRADGEIAAAESRAHYIGTALQLYKQQHGRFPTAYPADLASDLAPFIGEQTSALNGPDPNSSGAAEVNAAYVEPRTGDAGEYVLSLNLSAKAERALVLYADARTEPVTNLPVLHDAEEVKAGSKVTGGTLEFVGGTSVELLPDTSLTVVRSFMCDSGAAMHIVKTDAGAAGQMRALEGEGDVLEIAGRPAVVYVRDGVADIEFTTKAGRDRANVIAESGSVAVDGKVIAHTRAAVQARSQGEFAVNASHCLVPQSDATVTFKVLGKSLNYGANGPDCDVALSVQTGRYGWSALFNGAPVKDGDEQEWYVAANTPVDIRASATFEAWRRKRQTSKDHPYVLVLRNGDAPDQLAPFDDQPEIQWFCQEFIDPATGRVALDPNQALILFELGTSNVCSAAADFQDLAVLATFTPVAGPPAKSRGSSIAGRLKVSPGSNDAVDFVLTKPDGTQVTSAMLRGTTGRMYRGPVASVWLRSRSRSHGGTLRVAGSTYKISNDDTYLIRGAVFAYLHRSIDTTQGRGPGHWWLTLSGKRAHITSEPKSGSANAGLESVVRVNEGGSITVAEDMRVGVRVLGTRLKNSLNRNIPLHIELQVDGKPVAFPAGHRARRGRFGQVMVKAGSRVNAVAAPDSAVGSTSGVGATILLGGEFHPLPAKSLGKTPQWLGRAVDKKTGLVVLAPNQVLVTFDLEKKGQKADNVAAVLTFVPTDVHNHLDDSPLDGYGKPMANRPMGVGAWRDAKRNGIDFRISRSGILMADRTWTHIDFDSELNYAQPGGEDNETNSDGHDGVRRNNQAPHAFGRATAVREGYRLTAESRL
jgi:type II secretory pathway pseudopilin PulG